MTSTESALSYDVPRRPNSPGVWGMGSVGTGLAFIAAILGVILLVFVGLIPGVVFFALAGLGLAAITLRDRHGKSLMDHGGARLGFGRAETRGATSYHPGTLTKLGTHLLPGVLASSVLSEGEDIVGHRYAMITYPSTGHHVVALKANPDGASLIDDAASVRRVTKFGEWLARLAYEPLLVQAAISIEIAADQLPGLELEINSNLRDDAPALSRQLFAEMLRDYPDGGSTSRASIGLTFATPGGLDKQARKDGGALATRERLAARLPELLTDLPDTGAGPVTLMNGDDIIETVRCAYNPGDRAWYQRLRAIGQPRPVTLWNTAGPTAAKEEWDSYRHSDGVSVTWEKTGFTSSMVTSRSMAPLLQEHPAIPVLRVTWLYQPVSPAAAGTIAETDHNNAEHRRLSTKKPSARVLRDVNQANRTREAEAHGAGLLNFATLVTATVGDKSAIPAAQAAIDHMGPAARMHLRRVDGSQASAFAQGIAALGLVTSAHLTIPTSVRSGL